MALKSKQTPLGLEIIPPSPLTRRHGIGPVHSREVPLPLTRDYFDVLTLDNPRRPSSPLRTISRKLGSVGTGTEGAA